MTSKATVPLRIEEPAPIHRPIGIYFALLGAFISILFTLAMVSLIADRTVKIKEDIDKSQFDMAKMRIELAAAKEFEAQFDTEIRNDWEYKRVLKTRPIAKWSNAK